MTDGKPIPSNGDSTQRVNASRIMLDSNPVHPHLKMFEHLILSKELPAIAQELRERVKLKHSNLIDYDSLASCDDLKQRFIAIVKQARVKEPKDLVNLVDARPVNRRVLYERVVAGTKILDVGSGNGKRLKNLIGPDIVTLDPKFQENIIKTPHLEKEFEVVDAAERVVTTFNSMTQVGEDKFEEVDGIHVFPNHARFIEAGLAVEKGGNIETTIDDLVFVDKPLTKFPSVELSSHSVGLNTFAGRNLDVLVHQEVPFASFKSIGKRHMRTYFKDDYMTLKLNGELCRLLVKDGEGSLSFREREKAYAVRLSDKLDIELHLEYFRGSFYIINVGNYRGLRPFHSFLCLKYFTTKVKIRIHYDRAFRPIKLPVRVNISEALSYIKQGVGEGVVVRRNNFDYLVRLVHSLDLNEKQYARLQTAGEDLGLIINIKEESYAGVREVLLIPKEQGYVTCSEITVVAGEFRGKNKRQDVAEDIACINELPNLMDMKYAYDHGQV